MAWTDWVDLTESDYMSINYIDEFYGNVEELSAFGQSLGYAPIVPIVMSTVEGYNTIPTPDNINCIERTLDIAYSVYDIDVIWLPTKNWLGEYDDESPLDFWDVNRWFFNITRLMSALRSTNENAIYTGEIESGEDDWA